MQVLQADRDRAAKIVRCVTPDSLHPDADVYDVYGDDDV